MPRRGRREIILEAASRLFSTKGYHGTTIRDISDASGILSGSLYAHIKSKEDLLFEITNYGAEAFLTSLEPIVKGPGSAEEKLRRGLAAHIRVVADNLEAATVFFHEWQGLSDERRAMIQEKRDAYEALWARILEEGMVRGEFDLPDPKFARLLTLSAANWLYHWYRPEGPMQPEEVADRLATNLLSGLSKKEGGET